MPVVRSVNFFGKNSIARITDIAAGRNCVSVSVDVPAGEHPALIAFASVLFRLSRTNQWEQACGLFERNLMPLVEVPAGMHGYLTLFYRPNWLIYGGAIAIASGAVWIICAIFVLKLCTGRGD